MDGVKAGKERTMRRWRRLRQVGRALRCIEVGAVLLLLTWFSSRLPAAARCSGDLLRTLATALLSPRAVFLLGNAIVLLLFSGKLSPDSSSSSSGDIYDEFLESRSRVWNSLPPPVATATAEEAVYEDKAVCVESRHSELRRSRSERAGRRRSAAPELRRLETNVGRKEAKATAEKAEEEEERSAEDDDELRRAVEAFIAKQLRFHREESLAIVSSAARPPELIEVK